MQDSNAKTQYMAALVGNGNHIYIKIGLISVCFQ